jgi:hypothetical protein
MLPVTPTLSGWVSAMAPLPVRVVPTAALSWSASATRSGPAAECITPPPARMNGRSARRSALAAAATSAGLGAGRKAGNRPNRSLAASGSPGSPGPSSTSCGRNSATGPGRPVVASRNACRTRAGMVAASGTVACHLVTGASSAAWSSACDAAPR